MRRALEEAERAFQGGEVPVGALLVRGDEIVGAGHNRVEETGCPFEHAEIIAMREAAERFGWRALSECTLYVTLEPCVMCVGAAILARIPRIIFGAREPRTGACESIFSIPNEPHLGHRLTVTGSIEEASCRKILKEFFKRRRGEERE